MHGTLNFDPGKHTQERYRLWQGCPTILRTPSGRLYAGWYSGGCCEPSLSNFNLLVRSDDGGLRWSDPLLVIESLSDNNIICIDIQLWLDPANKMWLFWTQRDFNYDKDKVEHLQTYAVICEDPEADELQFSEPRFIAPGFLRCQPTVLSDGRILLCSYDWVGENYHYSESSDGGLTWIRKEGGRKTFKTDFDETMILERKDGSLRMLARTMEIDALAESFSYDGGATWTPAAKSDITSPHSRFFFRRLPSGRVLLIKNDDPAKRIHMRAFLSEDDGATWKYSLMIDPAMTSYPDAVFTPDGTIYMVHDRGRRTFKEILLSRFTEEDIMKGELVNHDSFLCNIISKAPATPADPVMAEELQKKDEEFYIMLSKMKA